eukprot:m.146754 g.146754  ORF g.146754 m.146754 type:complete len:538 (+) comp30496_c0_seq2:140-1753(+)
MHLLPRSWVSGTKRRRMLLFLGFIIIVILSAPWIKTIGVEDVDSPNDEPQAVDGDKLGRRQQTSETDKVIGGQQKADKQDTGLAADSKNIERELSHIIDDKHEAHEAEVSVDVHKPSTNHHLNTTNAQSAVYFEEHLGKSCQNYAEDPPVVRNLADSKAVCLANDDCNAIECNHGRSDDCTLRQLDNGITYAPADCYKKIDPANALARIHPKYNELLKEYPFQQVTTQTGQQVNIILVRSPFGASGNAKRERGLYEKYQNEILFMGISSFEDYPLDSHNPYSPRLDEEYFLGAFPGFLHMMHHPEKHFPPHVKTILMSQSDFQLPKVPESSLHMPKKYDFTYSATWPLGPEPNNQCVNGWAAYCKNWTFVLEALQVFCERNMTGVLVATRDIPGNFKCDLPPICEGKILQTSFISQELYFSYVKQSRFSFIPQIHDASPRVSTQALVLNVPLLMNRRISGGWKYINEKTGEFFTDITDFRESLDRLLLKAKNGEYEPRKWALENYDNPHSGKRLYDFVMKNFGDRVHFPKNTKLLLT